MNDNNKDTNAEISINDLDTNEDVNGGWDDWGGDWGGGGGDWGGGGEDVYAQSKRSYGCASQDYWA